VTASVRLLRPCVIDEYPPHGLGGGGEEVPAPVERLVADEPQVRLVDEGGGVQGVAGGLGGHAYGGEGPQLVVHEWEQIGRGLAVTGPCGFEKAGHVGHEGPV